MKINKIDDFLRVKYIFYFVIREIFIVSYIVIGILLFLWVILVCCFMVYCEIIDENIGCF